MSCLWLTLRPSPVKFICRPGASQDLGAFLDVLDFFAALDFFVLAGERERFFKCFWGHQACFHSWQMFRSAQEASRAECGSGNTQPARLCSVVAIPKIKISAQRCVRKNPPDPLCLVQDSNEHLTQSVGLF